MSNVFTDIDDLKKAFHRNAEKTIDSVYKTHRMAFMNFAKSYRLPDDEVIDVFQESVISLYQNLLNDKITKQQSSVKTYLFSIGKYKLINASKKSKLNSRHNGNMIQENTEEVLVNHHIQKSIASLGDACKNIITLYYYRQYSIEAIMYALSFKNENTVKAAKSRCLKKLKEIIKTTTNV